ncbi:oocyte-expressed protein homolog [Suncus etruscus]|uniref:oocyte-expressed protein homolog n=1 Tax=Suncus etruscus TaxID=109475 RepID=UPI00210F9CBD|nr:oocyte-expressed protein homolog [Suncus etruscus]
MCEEAAPGEVLGGHGTPAPPLEELLKKPLPPPRIHIRPWWFPVEELRNPLVFYLETWVADAIFGPDRAQIPQMEWQGQVLLTVDLTSSGDFVEIAIFGRPRMQNRMRKVLVSLMLWHRQHQNRAEKMQQLEDSLKGPLLDPDA